MAIRRQTCRSIHYVVLAVALVATLPHGAVAAEVVVPTDFPTLSAAIEAVSRNIDAADTIIVEPGTYTVNLSLISNLVLRGRETSRTFLDVVDTASTTPMISALNLDNVRVSNFTFVGGQTGIAVEASTNVRISNNVFLLGTSGTAVSILTSPSVTVENNTFVGNATALSRDSDESLVRNNIFSENDLAISPANLAANISFNGFFGNTSDGVLGSDAVTTGLVAFVDPAMNDLHLVEGSAAIDAGVGTDALDDSTADLGAFGGTDSDRRPFPVQNLAVTTSSDTSISVQWEENRAYLVTHSSDPGSYRIHYGPRSRVYTGTEATEGISPIDAGNSSTFTLSGLAGAAEIPPPTGLRVTPANNTLRLRWTAVSGAAGYHVRYGVASTGEHQVDVGNVTSHDLTGLINGTSYHVTVSALSQATVFLAVTALDSTADRNESAFSNEVQAQIGAVRESLPSNEVTDFPESIEAQPRLPDEGCFIATAAFGHYDAAQVQALRHFRDRYLLSHSPGRLFVHGYYRYSPTAARWLNQHPRVKPLVRGLLLPPVAVSTALAGQIAPWLAAGALFSFFFLWDRYSQTRRKRIPRT